MTTAHVIYDMSNPAPDEAERAIMNMHPETYFMSIGLTYARAEPNIMQECWHLLDVEGLPNPLPSWLRVVKP